MRLLTKLNLYIVTTLLTVVGLLVMIGTLVINDIVYDLNERLLHAELDNILDDLAWQHESLVKFNPDQGEEQVAKLKTRQIRQLNEYGFGDTGQLQIIDVAQTPANRSKSTRIPLAGLTLDRMIEGKRGDLRLLINDRDYFVVYDYLEQWQWLLVISVSQDEIFSRRAYYVRVVVAVTGLVLAIALAIGYMANRSLARRIDLTLQAVQEVARGKLDARISHARHSDEIDELQRGINTMAETIEKRTGELVEENRERSRAELELAAHRDQLEEQVALRTHELERSVRQHESFSYAVSHDLRGPLRIIDGYTHALMEDYREQLDDTAIQNLVRVRGASQRMGRIMDALLSLSRMSRRNLHVEDNDLSALAEQIVEQFRERDPGHEVAVRIERDLHVRGDPQLLRVLLENLIGNAWKYTSTRGDARVEFGAELHDGERVYFVRDNGVGFDMRYSDKLFTAFERLHDDTDFEGTGIGLATVAQIVERHRGRVWAQSEPGAGATFYFSLPGAGMFTGTHKAIQM